MIDAENFGIFITLSGVNCGQFWYFSIRSDVNCEKYLTHIQALIADDFGIFNTLLKNKHHPDDQTFEITSRHSKKRHNTQYRRRETGNV